MRPVGRTARFAAGVVVSASLLVGPVCGGAVWAGSAGDDAEFDALVEALRLADVMEILGREGLEHGQQLNDGFLGGEGGAYFSQQVEAIFDAEAMTDLFKATMAAHMTDDAVTQSVAFFGSDLGQRIIGLEISARVAFDDEDVQDFAVEVLDALPQDDARRQLVSEYVAANDLVARNVKGTHSSEYNMYRGLVDGGYLAGDDESYLAGMLADREALVRDTEEWAMSFHLMAYQPLSVEEQQANIVFSLSDSGQMFNNAMFKAFDGMYDDIFYRLGRLVARSSDAADL